MHQRRDNTNANPSGSNNQNADPPGDNQFQRIMQMMVEQQRQATENQA